MEAFFQEQYDKFIGTTPEPNPRKEKGLSNYIGENNCFLNVVIQALWHLDPFREAFSSPKVKELHKHSLNCVYCALEIIFTQYEFSIDSRLPPNVLREALAILFKNKDRFQLFALDDASEAFDAVLETLHTQLSKKIKSDEYCVEPSCIPHRVFGIATIEQVVCSKCSSRSDPILNNLFNVYTYAASLRALYIQNPFLSFGDLLRASSEDKRHCPNPKCDQICKISHFIVQVPQVFSVSIVWDTAEPSLADVKTSFEMINPTIKLTDIFDVEGNVRGMENGGHIYYLKGIICYYGKHYNAFFQNEASKEWYVFDDTTVKPIGISWKNVQERCLRGRLQPSVLFYQRENPHLDLTDLENPNFSLISNHSVHTRPNQVSSVSSSILPVSKVVHSTIEEEMMVSSLSMKRPEESFVFIPSLSDNNEVKDFVITRTNWLYRRQIRIFRLAKEKFMRVEPDTDGSGIIKDSWPYHDIFRIEKQTNKDLIIHFYSGKEPQYISTDRAEEFIQCLVLRASQFQHTFSVKDLSTQT